MKGPLAYAHARIRACRSHLLTRADAVPLFTASDPESMQRVLGALAIHDPLARLLRIYSTAMRGYRTPLFRALLQLHEIENVKLIWRKRDALDRFWIDLGPLATLRRGDSFEHTPYAGITAMVARAHPNDIAAAELAFDRWATERLRDEARRLPKREALARKLVELVADERDAQLASRGAKWYGLETIETGKHSVEAMRELRRKLCHRAFVGSPFLLAPAVAVVLLAEEEVRAVRALVERQGDARLDAPLMRALAGSELGA